MSVNFDFCILVIHEFKINNKTLHVYKYNAGKAT